jgi:uncharacterized protein YndB with AHSA1/START domain
MGVHMRILKWMLIVIVALAAVLFGGALFLPSGFSVVRSVEVAAPADKVWPLLHDPRAWKRWTVWNQRDPAMQVSYSGPETGVGAGWAWKSATEGDGQMSFTAAEPGRRLAYDLRFPDWDSTSTGELRLEPLASGTRVVWTMNGNMGDSLIGRWFGLGADGMIGPDFEAGLARLKVEAEKP